MKAHRILAILLALLAVAALSARALAGPHAARSPHFTLVGHVEPGNAYGGDVVAHAGFAYLSSHKGTTICPALGVRVYALADLRHPRHVSSFGQVPGSWTEKTIVQHVSTPAFTGELAVTSIQGCTPGAFGGYELYDVTDPANPVELARVRTEPRGSHEIWLAAVGRKAYVYTAIPVSELITGSDPDGRGLPTRPGIPDFRIIDVSDPRKPVEVGGWGAWRELGIKPNEGLGSGPLAINLVHSVVTNHDATRAYLSYWDLGTVILDISDPSHPRYLGRTTFAKGDDGNAHSVAVDEDRSLLVETHETAGGRPTLFDISDPAKPVRLAQFSLPQPLVFAGRKGGTMSSGPAGSLTDSVHDPKLVGNNAFFSWYGQGVVAVDVSSPRRPRFLARYLPPSVQDPERLLCPHVRCRAVWGVYPLGNGIVLASDMLSGLYVLRYG